MKSKPPYTFLTSNQWCRLCSSSVEGCSPLVTKASFIRRPTVQTLPFWPRAPLGVSRGYTSTRSLSTQPDLHSQVVNTEFYGGERGRIRCDEVALEPGGHRIAKVYIQNMDRGNSMNTQLLPALTTAFRELALKGDIRCIILGGDARSHAFCTGFDIAEMAKLDSPEPAESLITKVYDACQAIRESDVVTIAHIQGRVFGAGLELAASCDFRYATDNALFAMPEVELGIPSVVQARLLANIIGWQKTKYLVYTGNIVNAQTALHWGLVDVVSPSSELALARAMRTASNIAKNGPEAMKTQKRLVRVWEEQDLASGVTAGIESFASMFRHGAPEPKEYMKRFFEKRAALKRGAARDQPPER